MPFLLQLVKTVNVKWTWLHSTTATGWGCCFVLVGRIKIVKLIFLFLRGEAAHFFTSDFSGKVEHVKRTPVKRILPSISKPKETFVYPVENISSVILHVTQSWPLQRLVLISSCMFLFSPNDLGENNSNMYRCLLKRRHSVATSFSICLQSHNYTYVWTFIFSEMLVITVRVTCTNPDRSRRKQLQVGRQL